MAHSQDEGCINKDTYSTRLQRSKYLNAKCVIGMLIVHIEAFWTISIPINLTGGGCPDDGNFVRAVWTGREAGEMDCRLRFCY